MAARRATSTRLLLAPAAVALCLLCLLSLLLPVAAAADADVPMALSDDDLRRIPSPNDDDFDITKGKLLAPILIPRVSGTKGNRRVQKHFVDFFRGQLPDWQLTWQNSTSRTPVTGDKDVPFSNLILRRDPPWAVDGDVSRLTLVAHYDSKYSPKGFIGATDSAAPCAMLMHVARSVDKALQAKWDKMKEDGEDGLDEAKGVQILFLDGEEAFMHWTDEDSVYGARSLAEEWDSQVHGYGSTFRNPLDSISLFVLLDLLGAKDPRVPSYFLPTHWAYQRLAALEKRMRQLKVLESGPATLFLPEAGKEAHRFYRSGVDDDHRPFMQRGVEILHLIPSPFPDVWHEMEDDAEHLDMPTVRDWARLTTAFVVEWMDIQAFMPKGEDGGNAKRATRASRDKLATAATTATTTSRRTEL